MSNQQDLCLYLHLGIGKGASTFLQSLLIKNELQLKRAGYVYVKEFRGVLPHKLGMDKINMVLDKILSSYDKDSKLILSNEEFFSPIFSSNGEIFPKALEIADSLKNYLVSRNVKYKIIYVYRDLASFFVSQYNQTIKQGERIEFDEFVRQITDVSFDYKNIIAALNCLSQKGALSLIDFAIIKHDSLSFTNKFFEECDILDLTKFELSDGTKNPSLSSEGLEILQIAKPCLTPEDYRILRRFVSATFQKIVNTDEEIAFLNKYLLLSNNANNELTKGVL